MIQQPELENIKTDFDQYAFYDLVKPVIDEDHPDLITLEFQSLKINYLKFVRTLMSLGFRRIDMGGQNFWASIDDNVISEVDQEVIIDAFMKHMERFPSDHPHYRVKDKITSTILGRLSSLFAPVLLNRMVDDKHKEFMSDGRDYAYFYYQNTCVKVTKDEIRPIGYKDIDKFIWKNQIQDREFKVLPKEEFQASPWAQFVNNVADNYISEKNSLPNNPDRAENLKRVIGYLLHGYFEGKLKAIVFTDARISDEADGRSGKTLLLKGLGHLLNVNTSASVFKEINGKDFDHTSQFKWQEIALDTKLIHLNDVKKYFPIDVLFNDIAEGISRQEKNQKPVRIWVKMALSTNRTIKIHGGSAVDRTMEFEIADYYSDKFSPLDEFKHWFFRDWTDQQWLQFDNFMMHCVQQYLKHGLTTPDTINLLQRKLIEETQREFVDFIDDLKLKHNERYDKKEIYQKFKNAHSDFDKLKQRKFSIYLERYAEYKPEIKAMHSTKGGGHYYFSYEYEPKFLEDTPF